MKKCIIFLIITHSVIIHKRLGAMNETARLLSPKIANGRAPRSPATERKLLQILEQQLIEKDALIKDKDKTIEAQAAQIASLQAQPSSRVDSTSEKYTNQLWRAHSGKVVIGALITAFGALATHLIPGACENK